MRPLGSKTLAITLLWLIPCSVSAENVLELKGEVADNLRYPCGFHRAVAVAENPQAFAAELQRTNFDPCCLGPDLLRGLTTNKQPLKGISMGASTGVKYYFGGREFVIFYEKGKGLKVAAFRYTGYSASLSLPYGLNVTQGIIVGSCGSIDDYAGWFKTGEAMGFTVNYGMTGHFLDSPQASGFKGIIERFTTFVNAKPTGCNSVGLNTGLTTALIGVSASYYERASPIITIRGDRARKLQYLFMRAARDSSQRASPPTNEPRHKEMDFATFHQKTCNYSIPAQAWSHSSLSESLRNLSSRFPNGPQ